MLELRRKIQLVKSAFFLIVSHIALGIFQEKIFRTSYTDSEGNSDRFTYAIAYMSAQSFTYAIVAKGERMKFKFFKKQRIIFFYMCSHKKKLI
jgi:hypothetical protein